MKTDSNHLVINVKESSSASKEVNNETAYAGSCPVSGIDPLGNNDKIPGRVCDTGHSRASTNSYMEASKELPIPVARDPFSNPIYQATYDFGCGCTMALMITAKIFTFAILVFQSSPSVILLRSSVTNAAAIGVIIMSVIMMCKSRFPYVVIVPDMFSAPYLIQMSYQISDVIEEEKAVGANTLILVLSVFSLSAILHIFMASFRTLRFAEYLPYPVFCGLFSAVGLTIVQRSILFAPGYQIIPTCIVATSLSLKIFKVKESRPALTFVTVSFISTSVFYITAHFMGFNITDLRAIGWLVESPKRGNFTGQLVPWLLWTQGDAHVNFKTVQFTTILVKCGPNICYLLILIALRRSMQFANLNRLFSCRAKTNHELSLHGYSQLFAASLGTFGGVFSGPDMVRVKRMHGGEVFPGIISVIALSCITFSRFFGVDCVPKFVFTGILASEGIMMLDRFLIMPYRLAGLVEWLAVVIIAVTAFFDIFKGFFVGAAISMILFSIRFHRTGCVKSTGTGLTIRSTVDRSDAAADWLSSHGEKIRIIRLRGSVAFATVPALLDVVADILDVNQDKSKPLSTPQGKFLIWFSKLQKQIIVELLKYISVSNCVKYCCDKKKNKVNKYDDDNIYNYDNYDNAKDGDVDNDSDYNNSDRNRYDGMNDDNDYYENNKEKNDNHNKNKTNDNNCNNSNDNNNIDNNHKYHSHSKYYNNDHLKSNTPYIEKCDTSRNKVKYEYDNSNNDSIENHHIYPNEEHSQFFKEASAERTAMTLGTYRCHLSLTLLCSYFIFIVFLFSCFSYFSLFFFFVFCFLFLSDLFNSITLEINNLLLSLNVMNFYYNDIDYLSESHRSMIALEKMFIPPTDSEMAACLKRYNDDIDGIVIQNSNYQNDSNTKYSNVINGENANFQKNKNVSKSYNHYKHESNVKNDQKSIFECKNKENQTSCCNYLENSGTKVSIEENESISKFNFWNFRSIFQTKKVSFPLQKGTREIMESKI